MSIIYRPNRNTLADAMDEAREFENLKDMFRFITDNWNAYFKNCGTPFSAFEISDLTLENIHEDERVEWKDCMYVCTWRLGEHRYNCPQCIGMCATDYPERRESNT